MAFSNCSSFAKNFAHRLGRFLASLMVAGVALTSSNVFAKKGETRVLVDSFAKQSYEKDKETENGARYETYHLLEGKTHGGVMKDASIRQVPFIEVAEGLAQELKKRNFYPARSKEEGDLMIVVHRGMTRIEADWDELFPQDDDEDDSFSTEEEGEEDLNELETPGEYLREEGFTSTEADNAALIGFDRALSRRGLGVQEEMELNEMLRNERYFLSLVAFDFQKLIKTGEKEVVWSTRFSMDAVRVDFEDAHYALSRAASNYFGTNLDGKLGKVKTFVGPGEVTTGELEVVETVTEDQ